MKNNRDIELESFNEKFCSHLEYHLCRTFEKSKQKDVKGFWCDGVSWFPIIESQITKKSVEDTKKIETMAWLGKTGQDEYYLTIRFGKYSLERYARARSLIDCIPSEESMDWIDIDIKKRTIEIRLK